MNTRDELIDIQIDKIKTDIKLNNIKIKTLEKQLIDSRDVNIALAKILERIKGKLDAMPHKLAPLLVHQENEADIEAIILSAINELIEELHYEIDKD